MNRIIKQKASLIIITFLSFQSWAQDKGIDVDITVKKKTLKGINNLGFR